MSWPHGPTSWTTLLVVCLSGKAIALGGVYLLRVCMRRLIVDKERSLVWKGSSLQHFPMRPSERVAVVNLERVYAIQILARYRRDDTTGDYYQYQVNLVLDDGRRVLAFGHGGLRQLWQQGENLSRCRRIPLWGISNARRNRSESSFANSA
jgi:hypothetical protein